MFVLAEHADDYGFCRPGLERIAHKCRIEVRNVQRHLAALRDVGEVRIYQRAGKASVYQLLVPGLVEIDREERGKLAEWGIAAGGDEIVRGDMRDRETSPERKEEDQKQDLTSSLREDAAALSTRRDVEIATAHLQPLVSVVSDGGGFDVYDLIKQVWGDAWQQASERNVNPKAVGVQLCAALVTSIRDEPSTREFGMIGRLVGRFGKLALFGITEALMHDVDDWLPYATRVCDNKKREIEAARAADNGRQEST